MVRYGKPDKELFQPHALTLASVVRDELKHEERQWFARWRADYLRNFPLIVLEALRLGLAVLLIGSTQNRSTTLAAMLIWLLVVGSDAFTRRIEKAADCDHKRALRYRAGLILGRSLCWSLLLCWGLTMAPQSSTSALVNLGLAMMLIDGLSALSVPMLALTSSATGGAALIAGAALRDGSNNVANVAIFTLVTIALIYWAVFNLYYVLATRRIRTRRLAEAHDTMQLLINHYDDEGSDWLYELNEDGLVRRTSSHFAKTCDSTAEAMVGMDFVQLFTASAQREQLTNHIAKGTTFRDLTLQQTINNQVRWWSVSGRPIEKTSHHGAGWRGFITDVTATKQAEAKAMQLAHYDGLTRLPNRRVFQSALERALADRSSDKITGLLYIDIDHFKSINDTYGHSVGDKVLETTARRLEEAIQGRGIVARLGGDEFVVLLPDLNSDDSGLFIADRVFKAGCAEIEVSGHQIATCVSLGAAFAPRDANSPERLLRSADLALYNAKMRGRGCISVFDLQMQREMEKKHSLESGLRYALSRQELELHYQPQHDISTGQIIGYEALVRWNNATRGIIGPSEFIPIAETSGMIVEMGAWILRTALAEAAQWPEHIAVAINISAVQLRDRNFLSTVLNALAQSGVAPHRVELEITESVLLHDAERVYDVLTRLRAQGVKIALDDFGTGYSTFNYVRKFPFDCIKIDRSFVSELAERKDCQAIVRSVIALARDLNIKIVAEGVEQVSQLEILREGGCTNAQGFLFSKALPPAKLPNYGFALKPPECAAPIAVLNASAKRGKLAAISKRRSRAVA